MAPRRWPIQASGYVLSQGSTAHFSPDNFKAYAFPLDYILVTFSGLLSGIEAGFELTALDLPTLDAGHSA